MEDTIANRMTDILLSALYMQPHLLMRLLFTAKGEDMETRVATVGIIVENMESVEPLNNVLHEYGKYIIGRMGIPYRKHSINVICIAVDAPQDIISAMSGKIGRLDGVTAKTAYSNVVFENE